MTAEHEVNGGVTAIENPNAELIQGLREAADFLEQHPELPKAWLSYIHLRSEHLNGSTARDELTTFAAALGDHAKEQQLGETVTISGEFGPLTVKAAARARDLGAVPVPDPPAYEPILAVKVAS